jgi:hypothetical protein
MKRLALTLGLLLLVPQGMTDAASSASAAAGSGLLPAEQCLKDTDLSLAQQQRVERQNLFGRLDAAREPVGNTRYDRDGTPWIKTAAGTWRTDTEGYTGTTWSDAQMNRMTEWEGMNEEAAGDPSPRAGIFETKRALTSELIPPILQAERAFQCRVAAVCQALRDARDGAKPGADGLLTVNVTGCMPLKMRALQTCNFFGPEKDDPNAPLPQSAAVFDDSVALSDCDANADQMLARERELLKMAVSYDAAYRSLLQFSGNFDRYLGEFKGDLLGPIEQAMPLLSQLSRIPCFLSQCYENP